jgi:hypothetical protein
VALDSRFWRNRRLEVAPHNGADGSMRAEIRLQQLSAPALEDPEDGVARVERRRWFLTREFAPGECVGRYDLSYLRNIGHE